MLWDFIHLFVTTASHDFEVRPELSNKHLSFTISGDTQHKIFLFSFATRKLC